MSSSPFDEGDRVDHKIFGLGTVNGQPKGSISGASRNHSNEGTWSVPVQWDDPLRNASTVASWALRKILSPDARPFAHWDRQWQPLLKDWLAARRDYENLCIAFRPTPSIQELENAAALERIAFKKIEQFWEDERAGRHP